MNFISRYFDDPLGELKLEKIESKLDQEDLDASSDAWSMEKVLEEIKEGEQRANDANKDEDNYKDDYQRQRDKIEET